MNTTLYMRKIILYVLLMLLGVASCTNYDTNPVVPQQYDDVPLVILDTDNTYFNCGHLPIGLIRSGIKNPTVWIDYKALPTYKNTDGSLMFQRTLSDYSTLPDGWELYRQLLSSQPDHSVTSPTEVGDGIEYLPDQVIADISWTDVHPVKQVYATCSCDTGQRMWNPLAVINAIEGDALFTFSGRGTVTITDAAETIFTPTSTGNCRYQHPGDATWNATMLDKIRTVNKTTQNNVSAIADQVWQFAISHPDGFTLHITSMTQPTEGIAVSYAATQDCHSRNQLDKVVSHALAHDGYVGGWLNKDNGLYYFDSTRLFPEDQLDEALKFGKENGQYSVFILSSGVEVPNHIEELID